MKNKVDRIKLSGTAILAVFALAVSCASAEELTRDEMISQKLDCYSRAAELPELDWDTICAVQMSEVPGSSEQDAVDETADRENVEEEPMRLARRDESEEVRLAALRIWPFKRGQASEDLDSKDDEEEIAGILEETEDVAEEREDVAAQDEWNDDDQPKKQSLLGRVIPPRNPNREFEFAVDWAHWEHKWLSGGTNINYNGKYYGARAAFSFRTVENEPIKDFFQDIFTERSNVNRFGAEVHLTGGDKIEYEQGVRGRNEFFSWDIDGKVTAGYEIPFGEGKMFTPYSGAGYYFQRRETGQLPSDNDQTYNYYYFPVGAKLDYPLNKGWSIGVRGEYDFLYYGRIQAQYHDFNAGYHHLKFDVNTGYGFQFSGRLIRKNKNKERADFFFEPYVTYWKIKQSSIERLYFNRIFVGNYYYPDTQTIQYGLRLGILY